LRGSGDFFAFDSPVVRTKLINTLCGEVPSGNARSHGRDSAGGRGNVLAM
jgi:hypothetical protein